MDSKSLMIGDWVRWKNRYVQVASVSGIVWSFGHIDVGLAHCNDDHKLETHDIKSISPIPLTAEILEKNGFTKDEDCGYCIWLDKHLLAVNLETHNLAVESILIAAEVQIADNYIHIPALPIHYCHELQHALRLCGLDDLADNFIV